MLQETYLEKNVLIYLFIYHYQHVQELVQQGAEPDNQTVNKEPITEEQPVIINNNEEVYEIVSSLMDEIITLAINGRNFPLFLLSYILRPCNLFNSFF